MFRQLAFSTATGPSPNERETAANALLQRHPFEIASLLENVWNRRPPVPASDVDLGSPGNRSNVAGFPPNLLPFSAGGSFGERGPITWDHLIYAYMIENTRIYEIFRRVLHELLHGEKLGTPNPDATGWLRTTEELFFNDSAPFQITNVSSQIRNDLRAVRRNAYQRLLGMDLNHGADDGKPYTYIKAEAANSEFVSTFEELLREVWIGITYVSASSSANPTDDSKIQALTEKLFNMLRSRRQNGNLSREEFAAVAAMSWFHLTVEFDSSIVKSLRAEASGVEQRLFKIAERVGLPAHGLSRNFFDIAEPISRILTLIESGFFNDSTAVASLYKHVTDGPDTDMHTIITHWTAITGRDVKARKVAST
jgi:transcriptional regulator with XRE-family HTH domain